MKQEKFLALINKEIDGLLTPEEREELAQYLAKNPEARSLHREYQSLTDMLGYAGRENPPAELKKHIMNSLPANKYKKQSGKAFSKVFSDLRNFNFSHGLSFAVGVAAGLIFFFIVADLESQFSLTDSDLVGTIAPNLETTDFSETGRIELDEASLHGAIVCRRSGDLVALELELTMVALTTLTIQFDATDLRFTGVANPPEDDFRFSVSENTLHLRLPATSTPVFLFKDQTIAASPITIRLTGEEGVVQRVLSTGNSKNE